MNLQKAAKEYADTVFPDAKPNQIMIIERTEFEYKAEIENRFEAGGNYVLGELSKLNEFDRYVIGFPDGQNPELIINGTNSDLENGARLFIDIRAVQSLNAQLHTRDQRIAELENYLTVIKYGMRGSSVMTRTQMIEVASKALKSTEAKHE